MNLSDSTNQTRLAVAGAAVVATIVAALAVPGLLSGAGETPARPPAPSDRQLGTEPDASVPDGRHFGTIAGAYVGPPELAFDPMEFLVGDAARDAALGDGVSEDDVRDFYIRNPEERTLSLPVADDVVVTRVDCSGDGCVEGAPGDYDAFTMSFDGEEPRRGHYAGAAGWYWVTVEDGTVVRIDQQYLP